MHSLTKLSFLESPREVRMEWHLQQVLNWLEFDAGRCLDNVVVYASFELRCAIERYLFELALVLNGKIITPVQLDKCGSFSGLLGVIKDIEPEYRKRTEFANLISDVVPGMPRVLTVDFKFLKKSWHNLSKYCHQQFQPDNTFDSPNREFQIKGIALINGIIKKMKEWHKFGGLGALDIKKLPPEVEDLYGKYVSGQVNRDQARTRLHLMQPVLEQRIRQRKS
jgi:hypothetical protein